MFTLRSFSAWCAHWNGGRPGYCLNRQAKRLPTQRRREQTGLRWHLASILLVFLGQLSFPANGAPAPGTVYLVVGSDTAIWNATNTVDVYTRHPHYSQDSFTVPGSPSFQVMDPTWRSQFKDWFGNTIKFTWWMMGGNIFRDADNLNVPLASTMTLYLMKKYHGDAIAQFGDELSLHYHTFLWSDYVGDGKFYWNQSRTFNECRQDFEVTLCQYLLEEEVFPVSFRSGWHFMDNDWQSYLNQVLPYSLHDDYGISHPWSTNSVPIAGVEDWSHAPSAFIPFHPSTIDYQVPGNDPGWNVRSIKMQNMVQANMDQIFAQASNGVDQVACIWTHLPENFVTNVVKIGGLVQRSAANNPSVPFRYCTAVEAMQRWLGVTNKTPFEIMVQQAILGQVLTLSISTSRPIFQAQPFVCLRDAFLEYTNVSSLCTATGTNIWSIVLPVSRNTLAKVGIAVSDLDGNVATRILRFLPDDLYIDNLDSQYVEVEGNWSSTTNAAWGTDARFTQLNSNAVARVQWYVALSRSGIYDISVQVPPIVNSASNVLFSISGDGTNLDSVTFSNSLPGIQWVHLFSPPLNQSQSNVLEMVVSGTNQPGAYAVADVVRVVPLADTNPPILFCSTNIVVESINSNSIPVTLAAIATDQGDPHPVITFAPASGSLFAPGTNSVLCTATDASGNSTDCVFTVTVLVAPCCPPPANQIAITPTTTGFLLQFVGSSGQTCQIQRSADLISGWATIATLPVPVGGLLQFEDQNPPPGRAFYRVEVQ
jgi:hypothetical protein